MSRKHNRAAARDDHLNATTTPNKHRPPVVAHDGHEGVGVDNATHGHGACFHGGPANSANAAYNSQMARATKPGAVVTAGQLVGAGVKLS